MSKHGCTNKKCCCNKDKGIPIGLIITGAIGGGAVFVWETFAVSIERAIEIVAIMLFVSVPLFFVALIFRIKQEGITILYMGDPRDRDTATTPTTLGNRPVMGLPAASAPDLPEPARPSIEPPSAVPGLLLPYGLEDSHEDVIWQGRRFN